jgi:hypothetical protein
MEQEIDTARRTGDAVKRARRLVLFSLERLA